jgi:hypothetical protein
MRESRCMSLLPRTTLHSDSEQDLLYVHIVGVRQRIDRTVGTQCSKVIAIEERSWSTHRH